MGRPDTIFAPATGGSRGAIAIIRISGPLVRDALFRLTGRSVWTARRATAVRVRSASGELLDQGLGLWFPGPRSATGEDVGELHLHGGPAVIAAALEALSALQGLRPAEPGEFTRRSFENGKLDLTQVEAVADLVAAETAAQRRQAVRQLEGHLGALYDGWRGRLLRASALLEAAIDFTEEGLPDDLEGLALTEAAAVGAEMRLHLADGGRGEAIRSGFTVALVGAPNAGKSSLLNRLSGREAAIVDSEPGTTRDVVEVPTEIGGLRVILQDTAGLREAEGIVEREGVRRARARAEAADLRLVVFDGACWPDVCRQSAAMLRGGDVAVVNKGDLGRVPDDARIEGQTCLVVSALSGAGIGALRGRVGAMLSPYLRGGEPVEKGGGEGTPALTRIRHRREVETAAAALQRMGDRGGVEVRAEELRAAVTAVGRITGRVDVEDVLGAIFAEFCIGK
jgi:tRNA modification GTPase